MTILMSGRSFPARALIVAGILAAAALAPGTMAAVENGDAGSRSLTELTYNDAVRTEAGRLALDVALAHPLRGIGYGMFASYAASSPQLGIFMNTHDDFLRLAAEAGIPCMLLLVLLLMWACVGRTTGHHVVLRAVTVAYAAGLLFGNTLSNLAVSAAFWASLGTLLAQKNSALLRSTDTSIEGDALFSSGRPEPPRVRSRL